MRHVKRNAIWLVLIVEVLFFAIFSHGKFVSGSNLVNIMRQVSYYGIASVGMTFVILIAGIDLSIGSIITLVNMVCAYMMVNMGVNMWIAILASLLIDPDRPAERLHGGQRRHARADRHLRIPDRV